MNRKHLVAIGVVIAVLLLLYWLFVAEDMNAWLNALVRRLVMGFLIMALLISSSIICTTNMEPKLLGIPALGAIGYFLAIIFTALVFISHIRSKKKKR